FQPAPGPARQASWEPPVDVLETEGHVLIVAALPGVNDAAIQLAIEGAFLVIVGERTVPSELRTAVIHRLELPQGRFERRVPLPPGRYDQIHRQTTNGCLVVSLRKIA
ncbi:MAG: Hsp20/alpha crystallin family protein, partial [Caulobacteraceae bacterium]